MNNIDKVRALKERQQNWMRERAREKGSKNDEDYTTGDEHPSNFQPSRSKTYLSDVGNPENSRLNPASVHNDSSALLVNLHTSNQRGTKAYSSNNSSHDYETLELRCEVLNAEIDNIHESMSELSLRQSLQMKTIKGIEIEKETIRDKIAQLEKQLQDKDNEILQCTTKFEDLEVERSKYATKIELIERTLTELEAIKASIKSTSR
ncbi:hypothetical protein TrispH2_000164 [Trichoplax sp. H2]|uniref:Uncharacterized protein n=1 Tax=Trichoplax adhaerens TaxID=10228 RepID=B3RIS3_TRIAD|nr:predicted protein [Trichoplax adhaerens]EDV29031.1 predicted protein [Trichoplax adhaerens]RDD47229.1 hypothetical protein TrispH2_000164 [Trichoplax sp. H2]|eukprot:XP_002108233.1 predicted protein [Trichoplax adhaerens]